MIRCESNSPLPRRAAACCLIGLTAVLVVAHPVYAQANQRQAWTGSRIQGTPDPPPPYRLQLAFPELKFELPSSIEVVPGAGRLLVTEMAGKIYTFAKQGSTGNADLLIDLVSLVPPTLAEEGVSLFDAEFHPGYASNGLLFVCYVHPADGGQTRVSRFRIEEGRAPRAVPESEQVVITWPAGGHNAGCIEFGKDGYLYVATGDGSGPNPPDGLTTGQDISDLLGAILRIDVEDPQGDRPYSVPQDNPFLSRAGARPEIWAYGLRNPWKIGIDRVSGEVFAADNGWETWEMVHRITRGANCGWPVREGRAALRTEVSPGPTPIQPPIKDHHHSEANSVIGGPVYRGQKLPELNGAFVYGDYITGTIWMVKPGDGGGFENATLVDTDQRIIAFTEGSGGELYVLDYDFTGQVYELLPSHRPDLSAQFPRRLSETGLFDSLSPLTPAAGVAGYRVTAPRWMDGASGTRWVAIPGEAPITLSADQRESSYPPGTVFVKHLWFSNEGGDPPPVETQLLHFEDGEWRPYSYLWDEEGHDAELVQSNGASRPLQLASSNGPAAARTWHASATNECRLCHNAGSGYVLGFTPQQLDAAEPGGQQRQLVNWGVVQKSLILPPGDPARLVDPHDSAQPLDSRARSYLHANCAMCHHPGGNAIVSFYLRRDLPLDKLNTNKGTGIGTFGIQDAKILVPGDPFRSILFYRMSKLGYARMPYIGSRNVDSQGAALVAEWIASLATAAESGSAAAAAASERAAAIESLQRGSTSPAGRTAAIDRLLASTEGALALAVELHRGTVAPDAFQKAVAASRNAPSDIRGLFETFLPEAERRATLGASFDPQLVLDRTGDRDRGKLIFFSDGARCKNCHEIADRDRSVGPTLTEISKKYQRPAELLQHIQQPSLRVEDPFAAYQAVTSAGLIVSGLLVSQSDTQIELRTAERRNVVIARDEIDVLRRSTKSLMPERILSDLTAQEAADLLAYLSALDARSIPDRTKPLGDATKD